MDGPDFAAEASPDKLVAAVAANTAAEREKPSHGTHGGEHPDAVSVRTAMHKGHRIVVRTRYQIEVDGRPFSPHLIVDNAGRVHYHGLPTRDFASMVDLVVKAIDTFPEDFDAQSAPVLDHRGGHEHGPDDEGGDESDAHGPLLPGA